MKEEQINNLKAQSQYFLNAKDAELERFSKEYAEYKGAKDGETALLSAQVGHLTTWAERMNHLLERIEDGSFVVKERSGVRSLSIPLKLKPGAVRAELPVVRRTG